MKLIAIFTLFRKLVVARFSRKPQPYVYVAIGDSSVEGAGASRPDRSYTGIICASLREKHKLVHFYNLGRSFASVRDVLETQLDKAIGYHPDLITISVGANDVNKKTQLRQFDKDLQLLLKR